jgi:hypothetical protein
MKFKETWTTLKNKLKSYDVPKLLASRAFLVGGCVMLVAVAITVSVLVGNTVGVNAEGTESESGKLLGNSVLVGDLTDLPEEDTSNTDVLNQPSDLLSITVLNRETVREDAMAVLRQMADNPDALPDEKEEALDQISRIMQDMEAEANIEILALAKGIPQCVAVISGGQCSIVVDSAEISESELSQIVEIVYEQSGITPSGTKVILNTVPKA